MNLRDKVIVITGASSGFGEAIARHCARKGARIVLAARSAEKLSQLANELGAQQDQAFAVPTDVTRSESVDQLVATTLEHFGRIDVLVSNAGMGVLDRFVDARLSDFQEMVDVNVYGTVRCLQAVLPSMLRQGSGQLVIMASLAGLMAVPQMAFYASTKFALVGMARSLMLELYGTHIRCSVICPNVALTSFQQRIDLQKYSRSTHLVPWVTSEQVAKATVRAIVRRTHGEVLVPRLAWPLISIGSAFPSLARLVLRIVG